MSEPTFTVNLTRAQAVALLVDSNNQRFPDPDSSDPTVTFFEDLKNWYLANPTDKATSYWAQIKDRHEGALWRTVHTADTAHDAAWGTLTNEMQRRGLRYGELAAHITDMENGDELSAEDGTRFRILAPGQEITQ
ncbi:hypothetical protein [Streptomyces sp. NPDC002088]|uniref:hypothetical protein n=1 Tax=Streptomyces sp. NPDC002088 TaxID=3154665 RepID=UPI003325982C